MLQCVTPHEGLGLSHPVHRLLTAQVTFDKDTIHVKLKI